MLKPGVSHLLALRLGMLSLRHTLPHRLRFPTAKCYRGIAVLVVLPGCRKSQTPVPQTPASTIRVISAADWLRVQTSAAEFLLFPNGYLKASLAGQNSVSTLDDPGTGPGQVITIAGQRMGDFSFDTANAQVSDAQGKLGKAGKHVEVRSSRSGSGLEETLALDFYDDFPSLALVSASFRNAGQTGMRLDSVLLQKHRFNAALADASAAPHQMWTFQGSSLKWGKDEIFAMPAKFSQENPFGAPVPTKDDLGAVGGGIPVVAFWSREMGEAIGHVETVPFTLSIPVETTAVGKVETAVRVPANTILKPGEVFSTPRTFLAVYRGDFYQPLSLWSKMLAKEGLEKPRNNDENYAVSWCGWGYEFGVTPKQMLDTIPKLKELGIHWATRVAAGVND